MTDGFLIDSLHSLSCFIAVLRSAVFGTRPLVPQGSGRDGARKMSGRSLRVTQVGTQEKHTTRSHYVPISPHQSTWNLRSRELWDGA